MVAILEEIARESNNGAARIATIKALRKIGDGKPATDAFARPRRRAKAKKLLKTDKVIKV